MQPVGLGPNVAAVATLAPPQRMALAAGLPLAAHGREALAIGWSHGAGCAAPAIAAAGCTSALATLAACSVLLASARRRVAAQRGRVALGVRKRPLPLTRDKIVTATKRLPLWRLSEEMYLHRQLAPNPDGTWTEIQRQQARMRERVLDQQKRDMKSIERELTGFRLEPRYPLGELREGMWLDGRVSGTSNFGVWVDVGAYTERGEWIDGYLHVGQIREDGEYVENGKMMNEVYLGEHVRVRVREVVPATGTLKLSMRTVEDLPPLFLGKPRPYSFYDLEDGMKVTGIVRRVWDKWALVDIGADRLCRIHVSQHPREITRYGFYRLGRRHLYAYTAFARGAQLDLWIQKADQNNQLVMLTAMKPRVKRKEVPLIQRRESSGMPGLDGVPPKEERLTKQQVREKEKAMAEKAPWEPYVPHVDEWLEDAMEADEDTDSWVARTENDLFGEMQQEGLADEDEDDDEGRTGSAWGQEADEQFADDEFADDDFADGEFQAEVRAVGFGPNAFPASELDGWVLDDAKPGELAQNTGDRLSEAQLDAFFSEDDDEEERGPPRGSRRSRSSRR